MTIIRFITAVTALAAVGQLSAAIHFSGTDFEPVVDYPDKNTGLEAIYVLHSADGVTMHYSAQKSNVVWYRYSNLGGGYAEEISGVSHDGNDWYIPVQGDMGYIIDDGDTRTCVWVVDYASHPMRLEGISIPSEQDCDNTTVNLSGEGDAIHYYTINGQQRTLSRGIEIAYDSQVWDDSSATFAQEPMTKTIDALTSTVLISPAVYCRTYFNVTADRFLSAWGMAQHAQSEAFIPNAVAVNTEAEQEVNDDPDYKSNQISAGTSGLGGSAPAEITFRSFCTDAVIHFEWQMSEDPEFENIDYRFTDRDLDYTFMNEGTFYVRFVGSNSDGSCEQYGDTYTVSIGTSELKCPNAFSPGASEGVNDEWKVSYRSIIDFECWIFDRYGNEICHFTDPDQGWDGKRGGKLVKPGVYFYVVQATGADGKKYKKSGDINILRYKTYGNSQTVE